MPPICTSEYLVLKCPNLIPVFLSILILSLITEVSAILYNKSVVGSTMMPTHQQIIQSTRITCRVGRPEKSRLAALINRKIEHWIQLIVIDEHRECTRQSIDIQYGP